MGEQAEVGEAALDTRLQAGGGSTAAQWRTVLGHQVHKFLTDLPETRRQEALGHDTTVSLVGCTPSMQHTLISLQSDASVFTIHVSKSVTD